MDIVKNSQMDKVDYPALLKNILSRHVELCNRRPNQDVENLLLIRVKRYKKKGENVLKIDQ